MRKLKIDIGTIFWLHTPITKNQVILQLVPFDMWSHIFDIVDTLFSYWKSFSMFLLSTLQYMAFISPEKYSNHNFNEVFIHRANCRWILVSTIFSVHPGSVIINFKVVFILFPYLAFIQLSVYTQLIHANNHPSRWLQLA